MINMWFFESDELTEVMADERAKDLFIGGVVDLKEEMRES